jgi:hypothetical protein
MVGVEKNSLPVIISENLKKGSIFGGENSNEKNINRIAFVLNGVCWNT